MQVGGVSWEQTNELWTSLYPDSQVKFDTIYWSNKPIKSCLVFTFLFFFSFFFLKWTNKHHHSNKQEQTSINKAKNWWSLLYGSPPSISNQGMCPLGLSTLFPRLLLSHARTNVTELPSRSMYTNKLSVDRGRKKHQIQWLYICQIFNVLSLSYFYRSYVILRQQQRTKCLL